MCVCVLQSRVAEGVSRQGSWKETPSCWSLGMQHARGLVRLAPNPNTLLTPLPVPVPFLPHLLLPNCCPHPLWNGRDLVSLPLTRSAATLPQQHSCPGVAVAVAGRLSQLASQNSSVTSAELLENWTLPRTQGTRIRKRTECIYPLVATQSLTQLFRCTRVKIHTETHLHSVTWWFGDVS